MRETWNAARVGLMVVLGLAVTFAVYRYVDERSATESDEARMSKEHGDLSPKDG
jgi:hypothetical protein